MVAGEPAPRNKSVEIWTNLMSKYSRNMHVLDIGEKAMEDTASPLYNTRHGRYCVAAVQHKLLFKNMPHFSKKEAITFMTPVTSMHLLLLLPSPQMVLLVVLLLALASPQQSSERSQCHGSHGFPFQFFGSVWQ